MERKSQNKQKLYTLHSCLNTEKLIVFLLKKKNETNRYESIQSPRGLEWYFRYRIILLGKHRNLEPPPS